MVKQSLVSEFRNSLKNPLAEELVDLVFYRPLAFAFVKFTGRLLLTPNQVSFLAMAAGIAAGCFCASGRPQDLIAGGLLFGLSNVLDCADGMIARLKSNGTMTGRIVDGLVDYVASGAVYLGFGIGLAKTADFPAWSLALLALAIASVVLHSIASDNCRNAYIRHSTGKTAPDDDERLVFSEELARLQKLKGHLVDKTLVRIYLKYLSVQTGGNRPSAAASAPQVVLWNLIGPSTHITFFIIAALLGRPSIFFAFTIGAANVWMVGLFLASKINRPAGS
ncbi:MAG: CDP-alcohol phosphatidyltransferase family protein [Chitinispirillaceae bacterium]|nr:CDP-alcohol phosphatidyltransferase family protein [Chitinispirillaceae bacterium]